jgi:hypothetical protein
MDAQSLPALVRFIQVSLKYSPQNKVAQLEPPVVLPHDDLQCDKQVPPVQRTASPMTYTTVTNQVLPVVQLTENSSHPT